MTCKPIVIACQVNKGLLAGSTSTPVMCRVRERITRHGGETFDAPAEWAKYHSDEERHRRMQDNAVMVKPGSGKKVEKVRGIQI